MKLAHFSKVTHRPSPHSHLQTLEGWKGLKASIQAYQPYTVVDKAAYCQVFTPDRGAISAIQADSRSHLSRSTHV